MRRLSSAELAHTVRDLFGTSLNVDGFPADGRTDGFDTLSTALPVSPLHIEGYLESATTIIAELFESNPAGIRNNWCDYGTADSAENLSCARSIVSDFAALAWRRSLQAWPDGDPAAAQIHLLDDAGPLAGFSLERRLQTALEAVLVSPRFIYRVEFAGSDGYLDTSSLASRLSYMLWSSAPDAGLLGSNLQQPAQLEAQFARVTADPKFERFLERFGNMWLGLEKLDSVERDPNIYAAFDSELARAMASETQGFFADYWRAPAGTVADILLAEPPPVPDPGLAALYGASPRLGLITQAAILTLTGASNRTSPVRRGMWVLERLLCAPPPPPPDAVIAALTEELENDDTLTERERLARHRVQPSCAGCHTTMDAIGLGLENYDSIGAYRESYRTGANIDPSGVLPGPDAPFATPFELIELLAGDDRLQACLAQQLLTYGTGRHFSAKDTPLLEAIAHASGGADATFSSVMRNVVFSDGFLRRDEAER